MVALRSRSCIIDGEAVVLGDDGCRLSTGCDTGGAMPA
jgi:hypothetical protein